MEDVLVLYAEPFDPLRPVVTMDEHPYAFLDHARAPLPPAPGHVAKEDYEYIRCGSGTVFVAFQPLGCWRTCQVQPQRTRIEFAAFLKDLVDVHFPQATVIRLVCDNLNTHTPAALYAAYQPDEARRIAARLEWHYTPTHGSWLNMAEIELSVLARQCLHQRLRDRDTTQQAVDAWAERRNRLGRTVQWHFTVEAARTKLRRLYPVPLPESPEER
jgi:hypothetical protein